MRVQVATAVAVVGAITVVVVVVVAEKAKIRIMHIRTHYEPCYKAIKVVNVDVELLKRRSTLILMRK